MCVIWIVSPYTYADFKFSKASVMVHLCSFSHYNVPGQENVVTINSCNFTKLDGLFKSKTQFNNLASLFSCEFFLGQFPRINIYFEIKKEIKIWKILHFITVLNTEVIFVLLFILFYFYFSLLVNFWMIYFPLFICGDKCQVFLLLSAIFLLYFFLLSVG